MSSRMQFWFVTVVPKYVNCTTFSNALLTIFMILFCPAFWWRDNIYLDFSTFTSRQISLLASVQRFCAFYFMVSLLSPSWFTSSAYASSWCVPFNFSPTWLSCAFLMAYLKESWKAMAKKRRYFIVQQMSLVHRLTCIASFENLCKSFLHAHNASLKPYLEASVRGTTCFDWYWSSWGV
jgi:hypothetical protein